MSDGASGKNSVGCSGAYSKIFTWVISGEVAAERRRVESLIYI